MISDTKLVSAFTDEAGTRGFVRKLTDSIDHEVSLLCSLLIPRHHVDCVRGLFRTPYDKFCKAAPSGAKVHITDAFKQGNDPWRVVAEQVRDEIFKIMRDHGVFLTYSARRIKVSRERHELLSKLKEDAKAAKRSDFVVKNSNRPSMTHVDDDVMVALALMADEFAAQFKMQRVDFFFDEIDPSVADRYRAAILTTQRTEHFKEGIEARNRVTGEKAEATIRFSAPKGMSTKHLGSIVVAGKDDPIIFAADVVTNSLWRHLQSLPDTMPLNTQSSVDGWLVPELTFVDQGDSVFDRI
uniref:DUF3800 domain-containing protein n=1 Tax=Rhodopseudomonas palustris (strain BisA53) TaxID=316055 RepID=Q07U55_RHOP5